MSQPSDAHILDLKASLKKPLQWAFLVGMLTAAYSLFMPNYYRSAARLLPIESKGIGGNLGGLASAAAAFGVTVPGSDSSDANFVDVLNSRWLREQILLTKYTYHARTWYFGQDNAREGTLYDHLKAKNMDRAIKQVGILLSSSRDQKTRVITVSAETSSAELSQQVVEGALKLLESFNQDKGRTRGGAKVSFTAARLVEARRELDEAEDAFRRFLEANRNYASSSEPAVRLKGSRLEVELRLRQQLVTTLAMNREQALLEEKNDLPLLSVLDHGNLPIDKSRPARAEIVLLIMLLTGAGFWGWNNRSWLRVRLIAGEKSTSPVRGDE